MNLISRDRVSALIPARNEAENIARSVRSVAEQPEVSEIIVVDDHSEDDTPAVLEILKDEIPRLRSLRVGEPPEGWLGKTHALAAGAREATGNWLMFTDADTVHEPGSLAQVLERARLERADLVSLSPRQETPTWWEKAIIPFVYVELARRYRFEEVSDPDSESAAANGQYLLIRRAVYESAGGHAAVQGEILEDVAIARRVKKLGRRILFLPGAPWVATRMYRSLGEMWDGWRKNLYLLWDSSLPETLAAFARVSLLDVAPPLGFLFALALAASEPSAAAAGLALGCLAGVTVRRFSYGRALKRLGFAPDLVNYEFLGAAVFGLLLIDSLAAHRWTGSVRWKGRAYSTRKPASS
jgi:chlorobactene glucosyltransferase